MCKLIEDMREEEREEGREEGRKEGRKEGVFALIDTLKEFNVPDAEILDRICKKFSVDMPTANKYVEKYQGA